MDSGRTSTRGSASSMKWTAAELLDTTRRRTGGGERGYDVGTTAVASAMAGGHEGEELGRRGDVWGVQGREGKRSPSSTGRGERRGGDQVRGTHVVLAAEHLPACLAKPSSSLARQLGWAGRWAG